MFSLRKGRKGRLLEASLRNVVDSCLTSPVGYMEGICVFPEYQGQGISKELIAVAAGIWSRSDDVKNLILNMLPSSPKLRLTVRLIPKRVYKMSAPNRKVIEYFDLQSPEIERGVVR